MARDPALHFQIELVQRTPTVEMRAALVQTLQRFEMEREEWTNWRMRLHFAIEVVQWRNVGQTPTVETPAAIVEIRQHFEIGIGQWRHVG